MHESHSSSQKKDAWKTKYLDSLEQMEELERHGDLLKRIIQRLILAARGQAPQLDKQLNLLRHAISRKLSEPTLNRYFEGLSNTLIHLDEKRETPADSASPPDDLSVSGADLGDLLDSLSWPKPYVRKAKTLAERFRASSRDQDARPLVNELARMFGETLATNAENGPAAASPGLFRRLFGTSGAAGERYLPTVGDDPANARIDSATWEGEPSPSPFEHTDHTALLSRFLNRVQLPPPAASQIDKLIRSLDQSPGKEDRDKLLSSCADLINESCERLHQEISDLEEFLRSLTERLQDIEQYIQQVDRSRTQSARSNDVMQQSINTEMDSMRTSVEATNDLATLKGAVKQSLDTITSRMEDFLHTEAVRKEQERALTAQLTQRMLKLQDEADELRENVSLERKRAVLDSLTGLANRAAYNERMNQEFTRWKRYRTALSIAIIDIDHFKGINDDFGHQAGDKALNLVAEILVKNLRETDFIARYGGDEFVVLMPETTLESAAEVAAAKLLVAVSDGGFHFQGRPVSMTLSIGVGALIETDTPDSLFSRTDAALYAAKAAGRNCVHTTPA